LVIARLSQFVLEDRVADQSHLIGFGLGPSRLQGEDLLDVRLREDVVVATDPLLEPHRAEEPTPVLEWNVGIRPSQQDSHKKLVWSAHGRLLTETASVPAWNEFTSVRRTQYG